MSRRDPDPVDAWLDISARAARATAYRPVTERGSGRSGAWSLVAMTIALAVIATGLALRPAPGAISGGPVTATADDGMFRLELTTPRDTYGPGDVIEPVATITYLGPDPQVTISHATHPVGFRIEEVGGTRAAGGGTRLPCGSTALTKGEPITQPFSKGGSPDEVFDQAWYENPVLRMPTGTWRIVAILSARVGDGCLGEEHRIEVANVIRVIDDAPPSIATDPPPSTAAVQPTMSAAPSPSPSRPAASASSDGPVSAVNDDGAFRLTLTAPRSSFGPQEPIEAVAWITYLGPDSETTMYHGGSPVGFTITEVGGPRFMGGGMDLPCLHTSIAKETPIAYPFQKAGSPDEGGFDVAWYTDPGLRLPVGTWRIRATLYVDVTDGAATCGGIHHQFDVAIEVIVR